MVGAKDASNRSFERQEFSSTKSMYPLPDVHGRYRVFHSISATKLLRFRLSVPLVRPHRAQAVVRLWATPVGFAGSSTPFRTPRRKARSRDQIFRVARSTPRNCRERLRCYSGPWPWMQDLRSMKYAVWRSSPPFWCSGRFSGRTTGNRTGKPRRRARRGDLNLGEALAGHRQAGYDRRSVTVYPRSSRQRLTGAPS